MILLCDEDVGKGIPEALALVGYETRYLRKLGLGGAPDTDWLPVAGQNGWLVFSYNKKMLTVPSERDTIIREKVGIVYLTNGTEHIPAVLRLPLTKWNILEFLWNTETRPFVRFLSPKGHISHKYKDLQL